MRRRWLAVSTLTALAAAGVPAEALFPSRTAAAGQAPSALQTHESLRRTLAFRARGSGAGVTIRERRRLRANLSVPLGDAGVITGNTYVGIRIGDFAFQRPVSFDPSWRPGRTRASFRVASSDPQRPGVTIIRTRWSGGTLVISVVSASEAPIAAANADAAAGSVSAAFTGAARLGDSRVHLAGTATGAMKRTDVPVLDATASLPRLNLAGRADVAPDSTDSQAPVVVITRPTALSAVAVGTLQAEGTIRDDRSIASLSWSIDGGAQTTVPYDVDRSSGFVDDLRATFAFPVPVGGGPHSLRVSARDVAGNAGSATVDFVVAGSGAVALRTAKWGATCVDGEGRVQDWGYGTRSPVIAPGIAGARAALGNLALLADGTVTTLRGNPYGASGTTAPFPIQGLADVSDITHSSTTTASYALKTDGSVWAWGDNAYGQLGDGTTTGRYPPIQVPGLPVIKAISAGAYHALALDENGDVWTWGSFLAASDTASRSPRKVSGVAGAVSVSASQFDRYPTGAAIVADGTLWMWGDATSGQLGGSAVARETPAFKVPGVAGARSVAMGYNHALVLVAGGTVLARGGPTSQVWGYWGELGNGTSTPHLEFQTVPGLSGVVQVAAGAHTSHALMQDGTIRGWGENTYGSVGDGTTADAWLPVLVLLKP